MILGQTDIRLPHFVLTMTTTTTTPAYAGHHIRAKRLVFVALSVTSCSLCKVLLATGNIILNNFHFRICLLSLMSARWMRTKSNVFVVSLAIGDFLLIFVTVPMAAQYYVTHTWIFGNLLCKVNSVRLAIAVFTCFSIPPRF